MIADMIPREPYAAAQPEKEAWLLDQLTKLTAHHRGACPEYARLLDLFWPGVQEPARVADLPFIPVRLFKEHDLKSVAPANVFKTLHSSGTTGQRPSIITLDAETARRQTQALSAIMQSFLGRERLPMIIVDARSTLTNRDTFSARGAGILGLATFGRDHFYALRDDMTLDREGLDAFLAKHGGGKILVFGFTFMVWKHLHQALLADPVRMPGAILVHSGGWKKLAAEAVGNAEFKVGLRASTGIERVHNFYGMVEQVGSIFVECEAGRLHAPLFADVIVRDASTWRELPHGQKGILQVVSALPLSYPGHSLLTEDTGAITGEDDCPCGRLGRHFRVDGRLPRAEIRGCSDTHAANMEARA